MEDNRDNYNIFYNDEISRDFYDDIQYAGPIGTVGSDIDDAIARRKWEIGDYDQVTEHDGDGWLVPNLWRQFLIQKHSVNLSKLEQEYSDSEGMWLPQMELAREYLENKQAIRDLKSAYLAQSLEWSDPQRQAAEAEIRRLEIRNADLEFGGRGQEGLREIARTNPYLRPIFYNTGENYAEVNIPIGASGAGISLSGLGVSAPKYNDILRDESFSLADRLKIQFYDFLSGTYSGDIDPNNNLGHFVSEDGVRSLFGGKLVSGPTQEQLDYLWDSKTNDDNTDAQLEELYNSYRVALAREEEKREGIISKLNTLKKGNWYFDPTKISSKFERKYKRYREDEGITFSNLESWVYALPELGTSYSEIEAMVGQMAASGLMNLAAKSALTALSGGTFPLLYAMTEAGLMYAIQDYQRTSETKSEMFDAASGRALQMIEDNRIPLQSVVDQYKDILREKGYPVDVMTDLEIFNISLIDDTLLLTLPDKGISEEKAEQFNIMKNLVMNDVGLEVVRQTNLALLIPDYLINMLSFSYGGKYIKAMLGTRGVTKTAPYMSQEVATGAYARAMDTAYDAVPFTFKGTSTAANIGNRVLGGSRALKNKAGRLVDRTIVRSYDKLVTNPMTRVSVNRALKHMWNVGKDMGLSYFNEKNEEGIQYIVSNRYQRGDYDNIENYSWLLGAANAAQLGFEANLAYYGIHPDSSLNNDKELMNSMDVGGFTGLFMRGMGSTRLTISTFNLILTDQKLRGFVADNYADAERDNKVEAFLRAGNRDGRNFARIRESLQSLKKYKPEGVTDLMIDDDIELAATVSYWAGNKEFKSLANSIGAKKGSRERTYMIQNLVDLMDRANDLGKATNAISEQLNTLILDILNGKNKNFDFWLGRQYESYKTRRNKQKGKPSKEQQEELNKIAAKISNVETLMRRIESLTSDLSDHRTYQNLVAERDALFAERDKIMEVVNQDPISYSEYKKNFLNQAIQVRTYRILQRLQKEIEARKGDLERLAKEKKLDVNTDGISGIGQYVQQAMNNLKPLIDNFVKRAKEQDDSLKDLSDEVIIDQILSEFNMPLLEEFDNLLIARTINAGAYNDLINHIGAYQTGMYAGDMRLFRNRYSNLTAEEQAEVEITPEEYDQRYEQAESVALTEMEEDADMIGKYRRQAQDVAKRDLFRRMEKVNLAAREKAEEHGTTIEQEPVIPENEEQTPPQTPPPVPLSQPDTGYTNGAGEPGTNAVIFPEEPLTPPPAPQSLLSLPEPAAAQQQSQQQLHPEDVWNKVSETEVKVGDRVRLLDTDGNPLYEGTVQEFEHDGYIEILADDGTRYVLTLPLNDVLIEVSIQLPSQQQPLQLPQQQPLTQQSQLLSEGLWERVPETEMKVGDRVRLVDADGKLFYEGTIQEIASDGVLEMKVLDKDGQVHTHVPSFSGLYIERLSSPQLLSDGATLSTQGLNPSEPEVTTRHETPTNTEEQSSVDKDIAELEKLTGLSQNPENAVPIVIDDDEIGNYETEELKIRTTTEQATQTSLEDKITDLERRLQNDKETEEALDKTVPASESESEQQKNNQQNGTQSKDKPSATEVPIQSTDNRAVIPDSKNGQVESRKKVPDNSQLKVDEGSGLVILLPNDGSDVTSTIVVDDGSLSVLNTFEDVIESMWLGTGQYLNDTASDPMNPTESSSKQKKKHVANTFFYAFRSDLVIPIQNQGVELRFTDKDGKEVERRPGRELAENLAKPGWLKGADDVYFVVTANTHDMSDNDATDLLAIHLMIERDGKLYNAELRAITDQLRKELQDAQMSRDLINEQINRLRSLRLKIILAYAPSLFGGLGKPNFSSLGSVRKHVKPVNLQISNGSLNNLKESGVPKFRKLTEVEEFGMSSDPQEMTEQLLDPTSENGVEIGYGTGPFSVNFAPFSIISVADQMTPVSQKGRGYAGKLFLVPKASKTPSGRVTLPIMLSEELHKLPVVRAEEIQLRYDAQGKGNKNVQMSTAEAIFTLLDGRLFQTPELGDILAPEVRQFLLDLLVNSGSHTSCAGFNGKEKLQYNFLVRKQLFVTTIKGERKLVHARPTVITNPDGTSTKVYKTAYMSIDTTNDTEKKNAIYYISRNVHWNTDIDLMMSEFPQEFIDYVIKRWDNYKGKKDATTRFPILTNQLAFSLNDIGYEVVKDADGKLKAKKKEGTAPIVFTWYVNTGKIKTDLGEHAFSAPFVYADDVMIDDSVQQRLSQLEVTAKVDKSGNKLEVKVQPESTPAPTQPQTQPNQSQPQTSDGTKTIGNVTADDVISTSTTTVPGYTAGWRFVFDAPNDSWAWNKASDFSRKEANVKERHWGSRKGIVYFVYPAGRRDGEYVAWFFNMEYMPDELKLQLEPLLKSVERREDKLDHRQRIVDIINAYKPSTQQAASLQSQSQLAETQQSGKKLDENYVKLDPTWPAMYEDGTWEQVPRGHKLNVILASDEKGNISEELLKRFGLKDPRESGLVQSPGLRWVISPNHARNGKGYKIYQVNFEQFSSRMLDGETFKRLPGFTSLVRGEGSFNRESAFKWLGDVLGLTSDNSDVMVVNAIASTLSDQKVYGLMRVAVDAITGELTPQLLFTNDAGEGIEYHEGFHYVTLLLLNKALRAALYAEYERRHPSEQPRTKREVEELLAEEFRAYMLNELKPTLGYQITKFFKNIIRYIQALFGRKSLQDTLFKQITSGKFKNFKPDLLTLKEFYERYLQGLYYYIPGLSKEETERMSNITDGTTFYNVVSSLTSSVLSLYKIRSLNDVENLNVNSIFDQLQERLDDGIISDENFDVVQDVVDNKEVFKKYIFRKLRALSIKEDDTLLAQEEAKLATDVGDNPDNNWDKTQGQHSKKKNVAFNAKLFFYSVPKYDWVFVEENGSVKKQAAPVYDPIFGLQLTEDFNVVWNKIMDNLWDIDTFQDLLNSVNRLSKSDTTFYALNQLLKDIDNPENDNLKTLLETTIKSFKADFNTIMVGHDKIPTRKNGLDETSYQILVSNAMNRSVWTVRSSRDLRRTSLYPKKWSNAFFTSGNVKTDSRGYNYIEPKLITMLFDPIDGKVTKMMRLIAPYTTNKKAIRLRANKSEEHLALILENMKDAFVDICNDLCIPIDSRVVDRMLLDLPDPVKTYTGNSELDKLIQFVGTNKSESQTFRYVLNQLQLMSRSEGAVIRGRSGTSNRTADRLFTNRDYNAAINYIARAYGAIYPSQQEFSVIGADGALVYSISENNYFNDQIRNMNKDLNGKLDQILSSCYSKRSVMANAARNGTKFKLHTLLMLRAELDRGRDYFDISPIEDYITKMVLTFNDQLVSPTMSDKKTWYSISGLKLIKDLLLSRLLVHTGNEGFSSKSIIRRFSEGTLKMFANIFLDEFDAVYNYFENKDYVAAHPEERVDNYHGKIKNGKMDASGNGGRFRYMSRITINGEVINLNRELAKMETESLNPNSPIDNREILKYLLAVKMALFGDDKFANIDLVAENSEIFTAMNILLNDSLKNEMDALVVRGIIGKDNNGRYVNKLIPYSIMSYYDDLINKSLYADDPSLAEEDALYSAIGSHMANHMLSIIEIEKCITGDPAFYKHKTMKVTEDSNTPGGGSVTFAVDTGRDVDKTKRLSAVLSTGTNLRTVWDNPSENDTNFTVLTLEDNMIGSSYETELKKVFRNSILRDLYSRKNPKLSSDEVIKALSTESAEKSFYNSLSKSEKEYVDINTENSVSPYKYGRNEEGKVDYKESGSINQSDAAVYIRPAMYRRIMKALGNWSDEIEEAYNIMEGEDESWVNDPIKYAKTTAALALPLKMVYFGDHFAGNLGINIPIFDKMAMFPLFKIFAKADNKLLYDRMNNELLGTIDMIAFESSVKVGGRPKFKAYLDANNETFNTEELGLPSYISNPNLGKTLPVYRQDLRNLRLQLNTDPHMSMDRAFGTQAVKICLANLRDDLTYGLNKGKKIKGRLLKELVMEAINALTIKGYNDVLRRFFKWLKSGGRTIKNQELSEYLISLAVNSNMPESFIEGLGLDSNGEFRVPLEASSNRDWIASRLISYTNGEIVDVNTKGGAAILMSAFGFKATGARKESAATTALNGGESLKFLRDDGSMEVMLSTNFFRHIVPKEFQGSYGLMRKWLLDHNLIGKNAKPIGVGYRIPTQGLSSTFSFVVADVMPDRFGDTIVVPDGFTAMTGSDFDVDKIYIAMLNYDKEGNVILFEDGKKAVKLSKEALLNRIIQSYQISISDSANMAETRASIDTLTKILLNDILPLVQPNSKREAAPMYELLPSFLLSRKEEYTSGKAGIAPFALHSTNHALTQFVHLSMVYSQGNLFKLGSLDAVTGRDGYRILDWLSAMINAHVDVAKDPYVIALNVNQVTYNMTCLLLRGGMGRSTFYFLAQPILKRLANTILLNNGVYGALDISQWKLISNLRNELFTEFKKMIDQMPEDNEKGSKKGVSKLEWQRRFNLAMRDYTLEVEPYMLTNDPNRKFDMYDYTFNEDALRNALLNKDSIESKYQQILCLNAFQILSDDAERLSALVNRSQIDTKKYGNTLPALLNFRNSVSTFFSTEAAHFYITDNSNSDETALEYYFRKTFLDLKYRYGTTIPFDILKGLTLAATPAYRNIFTSVMAQMFGEKTVLDKNGEERLAYKHQGDKDRVKKISTTTNMILRARLVRSHIRENSKPIMDGDINVGLQISDLELQDMFIGSNTMCRRLAEFKQYLRLRAAALPDLVAVDGTFKNDLLNYLEESSSDGSDAKFDRIVLAEAATNNDADTDNRLITAFADLLYYNGTDNKEVNEHIRAFANDLARYAYYTSYDERGRNSFFNLVPNQWKRRAGYVSSIREGLKEFRDENNSSAYQTVSEAIDSPEKQKFPSISVALARNLWYDDDIVPRFELNEDRIDPITGRLKKGTDRSITSSTETVGRRSVRISSLFTTPEWKSRNNNFVKIVSSGEAPTVELYLRVGSIWYEDDMSERPVKYGAIAVYKRISKLGINDGDMRVYELEKESTEPSAFPQNGISSSNIATWSDEDVLNYVSQYSRMKRFEDLGYRRVFISSSVARIQSTERSLSSSNVVGTSSDPVALVGINNNETDAQLTVQLTDTDGNNSEVAKMLDEGSKDVANALEEIANVEARMSSGNTSVSVNESSSLDQIVDPVLMVMASLGKQADALVTNDNQSAVSNQPQDASITALLGAIDSGKTTPENDLASANFVNYVTELEKKGEERKKQCNN